MTARRRVLVCVGGGIAAYKSVSLVRELVRHSLDVRVAMTEAATRFVGPLTFTGIVGRPPAVDMWDPTVAGEVHVELAAFAELIVVAPATADLLAKLTAGLAGDVVLATLLCRRGPVLLAPAMHTRMWEAPATRANVERLRRQPDVSWVGPVFGPLASGEAGIGRMAEPEDIAAAALALLVPPARDLGGVRLLVTAGPTYEDLDDVRFLGNRSSGKMGFAVAERAVARGAAVTLIAGPGTVTPPAVEVLVRVRSALELQAAVAAHVGSADAVVMAAAVADYRPAARHDGKLKKSADALSLALVRNPDILAGLGEARGTGARPVLVGFAVESGDLVAYARDKRARKKVDLVVGNHAEVAFEGDDSSVLFVDAAGEEPFGPAPKRAVADALLDRIRRLLDATG